MTAVGVHSHDEFALGLIPHDKPEEQLLEIRWKAGAPPTYPTKCDFMSGVTAGLDGNDHLGDCGPTSGDNHERITTLRETGTQLNATLDEVLDLYTASTNPSFDKQTNANDNGVQMPDLLNAMRKVGLGGRKIVAFGKLKDTSDESVYAAISTFGAVIFAVDLQVAQQSQTGQGKWDYAPTDDWGGHAIVAGAYDSTTGLIDVFSWARRIKTTTSFRHYQLSEVWVPIWQSVLDSNKFSAVDFEAMSSYFTFLTGDQLPIPSPAPPAPTPTPTPTPGAAPFPGAIDSVASHITHAAAKGKMSVADWMNHHFTKYFG